MLLKIAYLLEIDFLYVLTISSFCYLTEYLVFREEEEEFSEL